MLCVSGDRTQQCEFWSDRRPPLTFLILPKPAMLPPPPLSSHSLLPHQPTLFSLPRHCPESSLDAWLPCCRGAQLTPSPPCSGPFQDTAAEAKKIAPPCCPPAACPSCRATSWHLWLACMPHLQAPPTPSQGDSPGRLSSEGRLRPWAQTLHLPTTQPAFLAYLQCPHLLSQSSHPNVKTPEPSLLPRSLHIPAPALPLQLHQPRTRPHSAVS